MSDTRAVVTGPPDPAVMSTTYARRVAWVFSVAGGTSWYAVAPPTLRILPMSYISALPFMASALSERAPQGVMVPLPVVVIQCICRLGPARKTGPPVQAKSHAWMSARSSGAGSDVRMAEAVTPRSLDQVPVRPLGV